MATKMPATEASPRPAARSWAKRLLLATTPPPPPPHPPHPPPAPKPSHEQSQAPPPGLGTPPSTFPPPPPRNKGDTREMAASRLPVGDIGHECFLTEILRPAALVPLMAAIDKTLPGELAWH